jgi:Tfp pilus assembly protein PilO
LDEENLEIYKDITVLIDGIDDSSREKTSLKSSLNRLRRNLNNTSEVSALVVDINEQIESG